MLRKILISNRGEIACRIIRTARKMGITSVAVYSAADAQSLHVQEADEAYYIGPAPVAESYLNIPAILNIAKSCQAEAIHPGYGFLSENIDFAKACAAANIIFIGPSLSALEIMGSKQLAKQHLAKTAIPLIPGYHDDEQSDERLFTEAKKIGWPLLIKAANGGGGKGMRTVYKQKEFLQELAAARREALAYFADDTIILEKLIQNPRHIEIQIMADNFGEVVHVFERDCSIQRRHQKVIEEAPAAQLPVKLRKQMTDAAIAVAKTIEYRGAGTIECLVENNQHFYFMEMNTRLQVEHPVSEMISGLDLVEWQIKIAANEPLPCKQADIKMHGHAIECRVYAEDPAHDFLPSIGQIRFLKTVHEPHIRIDSGITEHSVISMYYDPMIAKIIAWGETRTEAINRLVTALQHYHVGGVKTNRSFLLGILQNPQFVANTYTTHFLNDTQIVTPKINMSLALALAAGIDYAHLNHDLDVIYQDSFGWQMHLAGGWLRFYKYQDQTFTVRIVPLGLQRFQIIYLTPCITSPSIPTSRGLSAGPKVLPEPADKAREVGKEEHLTFTQEFSFTCSDDYIRLDNGHSQSHCYYDRHDDMLNLYLEQEPVTFQQIISNHSQATQHHSAELTAPMPGTIVAVLKQMGDKIESGEALIVLEAMKMEHTIRAPHAGTVQDIFYSVGNQVQEGATLAALEQL
ncbi:MAG: acetyl/propionyl/methylcrotonyl-CoA carboxylase subunit alpha [Gammaproteobacteria bacterium]